MTFGSSELCLRCHLRLIVALCVGAAVTACLGAALTLRADSVGRLLPKLHCNSHDEFRRLTNYVTQMGKVLKVT